MPGEAGRGGTGGRVKFMGGGCVTYCYLCIKDFTYEAKILH